ncbi:MAG: hypothetical protein ACLFV5_08805 [Anaerolineales bacterium]
MNLLSASHLATLITYHPNPSISLFISIDRERPERAATRLNSMLRDIEERLTALGLSPAYVEELLQPVQDLVSFTAFWGHQSRGLAIFFAPDTLCILRLPYPFEQQAALSNQFHIRPLLPLISADGRFYVLTLRQEMIELWQGTVEGLDRVEITRVPENLSGIWRRESPTVRIPTAEAGRESSQWPARFAAPDLDAEEEDIQAHLRRLDGGLNDLLTGRVPLILAGEGNYCSLYRSISDYPKLVGGEIEGERDQPLDKTLHHRGLEMVKPQWRREKRRAWAEYERLAGRGSGVVSDDLAEILPAAYNGEIKTLFVPLDLQRWGTFEAETGHVACHPTPEAGDVELLDQAAGYTFVNGGRVYTHGPKEVQIKDSAAAVFRY